MTSSPEPQEDTDFATRYTLLNTLSNLPFTAALEPPPRGDQSNDAGFIAEVQLWLEKYRNVLLTVLNVNQDTAAELQRLREQRQAIRAFLGTDPKGTT